MLLLSLSIKDKMTTSQIEAAKNDTLNDVWTTLQEVRTSAVQDGSDWSFSSSSEKPVEVVWSNEQDTFLVSNMSPEGYPWSD